MGASIHAFTLCQAHHQQQGQDVIAADVDEVRRLGVNIWRVQQVLVHLPQHATPVTVPARTRTSRTRLTQAESDWQRQVGRKRCLTGSCSPAIAPGFCLLTLRNVHTSTESM